VRRDQLEHLIRACAEIADDRDLIVLGSQAILGQFPDAPASLLISREADVYPRSHPERADLIEGSIGEGSLFDETFGYYAHGVGPETAVLPAGWEERLVPVSGEGTRGATGWCLEVHDLVLSKCVAGRQKDWAFAEEAIRSGLADAGELLARLELLSIPGELGASLRARLDGIARQVSSR
jgi:hypothetical protein